MLNKLKRTIENKLHVILSSGIIVFHNNTCPHSTAKTNEKITFLMGTFWSPYLSPSDYFLVLIPTPTICRSDLDLWVGKCGNKTCFMTF